MVKDYEEDGGDIGVGLPRSKVSVKGCGSRVCGEDNAGWGLGLRIPKAPPAHPQPPCRAATTIPVTAREEASAALPAAPSSSLIPFRDLYPLPLLTWPGLPSVRSSQKSERARQPLQVAVKVPARRQSSSDHLDHEVE